MTNREMAEKLVEIANKIEDILSLATPEQFGSVADIDQAGIDILTAIDNLGFTFVENRNGDFEIVEK